MKLRSCHELLSPIHKKTGCYHAACVEHRVGGHDRVPVSACGFFASGRSFSDSGFSGASWRESREYGVLRGDSAREAVQPYRWHHVNLPANPTYRKIDSARAPVLVLNLASKTASSGVLYDSASSIIQQKISRVSGVGQVTILGGSLPAVRVDLNPQQLSHYGLGFQDVAGVISAQNANRPKGQISDEDTIADVTANDQISKARDYAPLVIASRNNSVAKLSDIATITDSVENVRSVAYVNGKESVSLLVYCSPGANVISTVDEIKRQLPSIRASIPSNQQLLVTGDLTTTIRASVRDVEVALVLSIGLVIFVVFLFLRNARATLIPGVAVTVSVIGTFAVMYLCGYTLDNLRSCP